MTTLMEASRQWATRPADERFLSVASLHEAAQGYRTRAMQSSEVITSKLKAVAIDGDVKLQSRDHAIDLTNWSFGQLATAADAPAGYLQRLPAELAVQNLNHGIAAEAAIRDRKNALLFDRAESGMLTLRALTSQKYSRIWNVDVTRRLIELEQQGPWQPAPAAFDGSRGLYLGDRDMFAFMVDNDRRIFESLPGGGLSRGFFVVNSENGATSFRVFSFAYNHICGNHMVWGATNLKEVKIRHVGSADEKAFDNLYVELKTFCESSATDDELKVKKMRDYVIGKDLEEVLDTVMGLRISGLPKSTVEAGYKLATEREDWYGAPNTMWGLAGGITEIARDLPNANDRTALEASAGKLMEVAF